MRADIPMLHHAAKPTTMREEDLMVVYTGLAKTQVEEMHARQRHLDHP